MTTDGGGWTVFYAASGLDGEQAMVSDLEVLLGNPLAFGHHNLSRAKKVALSAAATETLFVRSGGIWLRGNAPAFDATLLNANQTTKKAITLTASNGVTAPAFLGFATFNLASGGDFGLSLSPDGATCNGTTVQGFDHHATAYRMLNCGCQRHYLYSYSAGAADNDAGYDVNTALGAWTATQSCHAAEGGTLSFYAAMR